ncbi:hypothetical protein ES707_18153 [subsurface metagenome]
MKKLSGMNWIISFFIMIICCLLSGIVHTDPFATSFSDKPEHAVLLIIDGLSYKVWDKMELSVLEKMAVGGALVEKNYLPPAAHPTTGAYRELHSGSIPNPILMAGTVFITKETRYLQECFYPGKTTAFVTNSLAYETISYKYHYTYQKRGRDSDAVEMALEFMKLGKPSFMRVHLQDSGGAGSGSMRAGKDKNWRWNIWADNSPYRVTVNRADSLVGEFIKGLEKQGILDKTVLIVMGDHGQNDTGWHPLEYLDSSITSIVLWGAGIKKGVKIPYSEQIDVVPTICELMDVEPPETSQGRIIAEAFINFTKKITPRRKNIKELNELLIEYRKKMSETAYMLEKMTSGNQGNLFSKLNREIRERFYDINRFSEWPRFQTVEELLENNRNVMKNLDEIMDEIRSEQ